MERIGFIFHSKDRKEHSIENTFFVVEKGLTDYQCENYFCPEKSSKSIFRVFKNLIYARKVSKGCDIVHMTGDIQYITLALPKKKTILTIHDCVQIDSSHGIKKLLMWLFYFYFPIKRARFVTTVSYHVKAELEKKFPCCKKKIQLVTNTVSPLFVFSNHVFRKDKTIILIVGTRSNKNLARIIQSVSTISNRVCLDIIGKISEKEENEMKKWNICFSQSFNITNEQVVNHYSKCDILLFPSLYEGFGVPIIEAQSVGRVVITSNIEPMVSVASGGAIFVDPYNEESIRKGIIQAIENDSMREDIIKKGLENVKNYQPSFVSNEYRKVYQKIRNEKD